MCRDCFPAVSGAAWATDDYGCSNDTLRGEYAFGATAYTPPPLPNGSPPPQTEVVTGIKVFDGQGNLTQRDYRGDNLLGPDFAPPGQETGTYTVNSDCTGSMEIHLNVPNTPAASGIIDIKFVISDGGRHIHEVVSPFIPPGASKPASTQTNGDEWKIATTEWLNGAPRNGISLYRTETVTLSS